MVKGKYLEILQFINDASLATKALISILFWFSLFGFKVYSFFCQQKEEEIK